MSKENDKITIQRAIKEIFDPSYIIQLTMSLLVSIILFGLCMKISNISIQYNIIKDFSVQGLGTFLYVILFSFTIHENITLSKKIRELNKK